MCWVMGLGTRVMADAPARAAVHPNMCLDWSADPSLHCPTATWISSAVENVVGQRLFARERCEVTVQARVERTSPNTELRATVTLVDRGGAVVGSRRLQGGRRSCMSLGGPVTLVIALMVEAGHPHAVLEAPPEVMPESPPEAPPDDRRDVSKEPPTRSTEPNDWTTRFRAGVVGAWGLLAGFAIGQGIGIGITPPHFAPLLVDATLFWPAPFEREGRGGTFWAWQTGASICPRLAGTSRADVSLCGGVRAGAVNGTGLGLDYQQSASRPLVTGEGKVVASVALVGPLALYGQLGVSIPMLWSRFVYWDRDAAAREVFQPAALAAFGGVGVELRGFANTSNRAGQP